MRNKIITAMAIFLIGSCLSAQESKIDHLRLQLSSGYDSLVVKYDLSGKRPAFDVRLNVRTGEGVQLNPRTVSGDIGVVKPGLDRTIWWDMKNDGMDLTGRDLQVKVVGSVFIPEQVKRKLWIPWLYIASAACAVTSGYAQYKVDQLYKDYSPSEMTDEAEKIHSDVVRMQNLRDAMAGAAVVLGAAGVVVHIRHIQKKKAAALSYIPLHDGAALSLTLKF